MSHPRPNVRIVLSLKKSVPEAVAPSPPVAEEAVVLPAAEPAELVVEPEVEEEVEPDVPPAVEQPPTKPKRVRKRAPKKEKK